MALDLIRRIRTGGFYELARDVYDGTEPVLDELVDTGTGIQPGIYTTTGYVFGQARYKSFGFCSDGETLVMPYHSVGEKTLKINGKEYVPTMVDKEADVVLFGGHHMDIKRPTINEVYFVKNPVTFERIRLQCRAVTERNVCIFIREGNAQSQPLEGWSGLPILDNRGNVYGMYSVHVQDFGSWTTRCKVGLSSTATRDWKRVVNQALETRLVRVVAGTGAGKTVGITKAILEKRIRNAIVLQPTRAMVENLYQVFARAREDIGFIHGEGSFNPTASVVIMTYGSFLMRTINRMRMRPSLIFCDEVHELKAEVQATLLYLDRLGTIPRIYATATPEGDVRPHSGRYTITDGQIVVRDAEGEEAIEIPRCGRLSKATIRQNIGSGILFFFPTKRGAEEIAAALRREFPNFAPSIKAVTADNVNKPDIRTFLASDLAKIIVCTNCLESGVTLKIGSVIDSGLTVYPVFTDNGIDYREVPTTDFEKAQRRGRVGRTGEGRYFEINQNRSEYDKYQRTFQHLAIYCKALAIPLPEDAQQHFATCPNLEAIITTATDRQLKTIICKEKVDPIMILQYTDQMGRIWVPFRNLYNLRHAPPTIEVERANWVQDQGQTTKPRYIIGDQYVNSERQVMHTNLTLPLAFGALLASYVFNNYMNKVWTNYETNMLVSWQEYVESEYIEVGQVRLGGRDVNILRLTELDAGVILCAASAFKNYMLPIVNDNRDSLNVITLRTYEITSHASDVIVTRASPFVSNFIDFTINCDYTPFVTVFSKLADFFRVSQFKMSQPPLILGTPQAPKMNISMVEQMKNQFQQEWYLPYFYKTLDFLKEKYVILKPIAGKIMDTMTEGTIKYASDIKTFYDTRLTEYSTHFSVFRSFTGFSSFSIKNVCCTILKSIISRKAGLNINYSAFLTTGIARTMTLSTYTSVFSYWAHLGIELATDYILAHGIDFELKLVTEVGFTIPSNVAVSNFSSFIKGMALLSSAALAGITLVTADFFSADRNQNLALTSSGKLDITVASSCTAIGLSFGFCLGLVKRFFDSRQEERMTRIGEARNPNTILQWMEDFGRGITTLSVTSLKAVAVLGFGLLSPTTTVLTFTGYSLLNGFTADSFSKALELLPTIFIMHDVICNRDIPGIMWCAAGPLLSQLIAPTYNTLICMFTNFQASVKFTEGNKIASSHSYSTIATIDKEFRISGKVLIIGEGSGGMSQYINSLSSVEYIDRVCKQTGTIPSLTGFGNDEKLRKFYRCDFRNADIESFYDTVVIDVYREDFDQIKNEIAKFLYKNYPTRVISSCSIDIPGYGLVKRLGVKNLIYYCYVLGHNSTHSPLKILDVTEQCEVYLPSVSSSFSELPDVGRKINTSVYKTFDSGTLETVGRTTINRSFQPSDSLRINGALAKTSINIYLQGEVKNITQASRRLDRYREAIHSRVDIKKIPVRSLCFDLFVKALELVCKPIAYTPYTLEEAVATITKDGSSGLTDCYGNMKEWLEAGNARDLSFDEKKVIWSMVPKYENRKAAKGTFPPPRIVTMSNLEFRFFSHQLLGKLNEESLIYESNGKMPFFVMMNEIVKEKKRLEAEFGEPYVYYAGDVSVWDARPTVSHIDAMCEIICKHHSRPDLVRLLFKHQKKRFCITCDGEVLYKVGGVDSGSVTTKLGNDLMNAARDLVCVSVSVSQDLEVVRKRIKRLVCGDDFIGVMPSSYAKLVRAHYGRVSAELGFPLKEEIVIETDPSHVEFCSHYWIVSARDGVYLPYRCRRDILERLYLQANTSDVADDERAGSKIFSFLLMYGHDPVLRKQLYTLIKELGLTDLQLTPDSNPYSHQLNLVSSTKDLGKTLDKCYLEWYGVKWTTCLSSVKKRAIVNRTTVNQERVDLNSIPIL